MNVNERRCMNCKHSRMTGSNLRCHRYPPTALPAVSDGTAAVTSGWPEVASNTFCGEWAAAEPKPAPTPEEPKYGAATAEMLDVAVQNGRLNERGDVVAWLTEAQFHVVGQDEVAVILKLREQFRRGLHERRKS